MPTEPLLFFKPPSSLLRPGGAVRLPAVSERVDFEGELALVIGRRAYKLSPEDNWREVVRGFTLANDISARDLQKKDAQWTRAKGFDTFCPVGPLVSDELDLDAGVTIETRVNGEVRQHASTLDFIFPIPVLLSYITAAFTLEPGDLILTGTPSGVGPLKAGDSVEVSIPGLGVLAEHRGSGVSAIARNGCTRRRLRRILRRGTLVACGRHANVPVPKEESCRRICWNNCASTPWWWPTPATWRRWRSFIPRMRPPTLR